MTVQVDSLQFWFQTRNTIVNNMTLALQVQQVAVPSTDPASPFAKSHAAVDECFASLRTLAVNALKQIDLTIATSGLIADITALSVKAKRESERIAAITHKIEDIADAVNLATGVVTKIAKLPFL